MFWRFGAHVNAPNIDSLLDNPNITLEEVLDQNDLLQELKQQNVKIIGFLSRASTIERLLEYVVAPKLEVVGDGNHEKGHMRTGSHPQGSEEKTGEDDEKRLNRYAYISTEILSSDTRQICDSLMRNRRLMAKFWTFLEFSPPLDPLQASYFTRVNENLLERSTHEMLEFFKSLEGVVEKILVHVDSPMIMDLLLKIISLEKSEGGQGIVDWLQSQGLIQILISFLSSEHTWATQTSAGDFLKAIITISANTSQNQQSCVGPNELTRQLVSRPCIEELITYMLEGGNSLTVGVGIVIEVIRKNNSDYDPLFNAELYTPSTRDPIFLGTLLRLFAQRVPDFMSLMLSPNQNSISKNWPPGTRRTQLNAAFGEKIEPLGFDRFKVCELMAEILHCSNMGLLNEPDSEEIIRKRDAERERLKNEGKLVIFPEDSNTLTPKRDDAKKLQVHNVSDDDGFERVSHSVVDDATDFYNSEPTNLMDKDDEEYAEQLSPKIIMEDPATSEKDTTSFSPMRKISRKLDTIGLENESHEQIGYQITEQLFTLENELSTATLEEHPCGKDSTSMVEANPSNEVSQSSDPLSEIFDRALLPSKQTPEVPKVPSTISKPDTNVMEYSNYKPAPLSVVKTNVPDSKVEAYYVSEESSLTGVDSVMEECGDQSSQTINVCMNILDFPIVGDFLKIQFVKYKVVPTILDFFFRFPWNNFLHNVVYDIVQQVFNGHMDRGFNRSLAFDLFETGDITMKIVNGQKKSDEMIKLRLGYMGHLTLIAEEVVKFTARHPSQLFPNSVLEKVMDPEWITFVEVILTETRERDNAILGGVRPVKTVVQRQMGANIVGNFGTALADTGLTGFDTGNGEEDNMVGVEQATEPPPQKLVALPLSIPPNRRRRQLASTLALLKPDQEKNDAEEQEEEISVTTRAKKRLSLDDNELD